MRWTYPTIGEVRGIFPTSSLGWALYLGGLILSVAATIAAASSKDVTS